MMKRKGKKKASPPIQQQQIFQKSSQELPDISMMPTTSPLPSIGSPDNDDQSNPSTLGRYDLFDKWEKDYSYPLEHLSAIFSSNDLPFVALNGVDQLTDMFFMCLDSLDIKSQNASVSSMSLKGCRYLTDSGIHFMIKAFPNLEKVSLAACDLITNDGLAEILHKLPKLTEVDVQATDVSLVLPLASSKVTINLSGCPHIFPKVKDNTTSYPVPGIADTKPNMTYKVLALSSSDVTWSLPGTLKKSNSTNPVEAALKWKSAQGNQFNIMQCPPMFIHVFSTPRTIYLIPFSLDKDINDNVLIMTNMVIDVLIQHPAAVFCLTGISESGKPISTVKNMYELLIQALTDEKSGSILSNLKANMKNVLQSINSGEHLDFPMQRAAADTWRLCSALQNDLSARILTCTVDCAKQAEAITALDKTLQKACIQVNKSYPAYAQLPETVIKALSAVTKKKGVHEIRTVAKELKHSVKAVFGTNLSVYVKILELLDIQGSAVVFTANEKTYVVTDIEWLTEVLSVMLTTTSTTADHHKCLHPDTPVIHIESLDNALKSLITEAERMPTVLLLVGALSLGWMDNNTAIVISSFLKPEPPVPLEPQLREGSGDMAMLVKFELHMPLPEGALNHFLGLVVHDVKPLLLWRRGVLIQCVPSQVTIRFTGPSDKPQLITMVSLHGTICNDPPTDSKNVELAQVLEERVRYYRMLVVYTLKAWHVSYSYGHKGDSTGLLEMKDFGTDNAHNRKNTTWQAGMRLEATDIQNPHLMCVATVERVLDGSQINVHFDGWTERYDYICKTSSPHLHPVGYSAHIKASGAGRGKLEAPKGYQKNFIWPDYLKEVEQPAVPYLLFSKEQIAGTPQMKGLYKQTEDTKSLWQGELINVPDEATKEALAIRKFISKHQFEPNLMKGGEDGADVAVSVTCQHCGDNERYTQHTWAMLRDVDPTFCGQGVMAVEGGFTRQEGSRFTAPAQSNPGVGRLEWPARLVPGSFSAFSLVVLNGQRVAVTVSFGLQTYGLEMGTGNEKILEKQEGITDRKEVAHYKRLSVQMTTRVTGLSWQAGMRLEAKDIKNPHLMCVATVERVLDDGQINIHFDGWTERYDYICKTSSPHLHPIGYSAHIKASGTGTGKLEAPNGYGKSNFVWKDYLKEVGSYPVPYQLFSEEQIAGTPDKAIRSIIDIQTQDLFLAPCLQFTCDGEAVWDVKCQTFGSLEGAICVQTLGRADILVDVSSSVLTIKMLKWEVGMRLEAKDIQNPSMICVATVERVFDDGKVNIHFDGWTTRYDYISEKDSPNLHPIGYCAHVEKIGARNGKLTAPKGYSKPFNWRDYLKEVNCTAVSHSLFNTEQTAGSPKMVIPFDVEKSSQSILPCTQNSSLKALHRGLNSVLFAQFGNRPSRRTLAKQIGDMSDYGCITLLPAVMTRQNLRYPRICSIKDLAVYWMCFNHGEVHLVDAEGYAGEEVLAQISPFLQFMVAFSMLMLTQQNFLPKAIIHLVKDASGLSLEELESDMRELLKLHLVTLSFLGAMNKSNPTINNKKAKEFTLLARSIYDAAVGASNLAERISKIDDHLVCADHHPPAPGCGLVAVPVSEMARVLHLTVELQLTGNQITQLPQDLFTTLPHLETLVLGANKLTDLPSLEGAAELKVLDVSKNKLTTIPDNMGKDAPNLESLNIGGNPLAGNVIPACIYQCVELMMLNLKDLGIAEVSTDMKNLTKLEYLDMSGNTLSVVPPVLGMLTSLKELDISGIAWFSDYDTARSVLSRQVFDEVMMSNMVTAALDETERSALFSGEDGDQQGTLDHKGITRLNTSLYTLASRLGKHFTAEGGTEAGQKEAEEVLGPIFNLKELRILRMQYQAIHEVPSRISSLTHLELADFSHCPSLEAISSDLTLCTALSAMYIKDCGSLKTPPKEIARRGYTATMGYLKRLHLGSVTCKRTKLMMVGLGGAGKTSTIKAMMSEQNKYAGDLFVTDGIDIMTWNLNYDKANDPSNTVTFSVWDFAGQTVYYNTHQFFLSNRAVYLLMWNVRLGHEHAGLDFWLSSIACHAPKAPVLVVGTHIDQVEKFWLPAEALKKQFPQIVSFHSVSSYTGDGIAELSKEIYDVGLMEKYMGEKIPQVWLKFEDTIIKAGKTSKEGKNLLEWTDVQKLAEEVGILDDVELKQATRFLHDLGSLQHFDNDFLKSKVVINPQWIVNVMSCVVSVHENEIKDGKLLHADIDKIWKDYPEDLHRWLLRLTEVFDLTFPLLDEPANLIACLLPDKEPEYTWQDVGKIPGQHETKMLYRFDYLPAGLFNRAQVRLSQFSDSSIIWKKGSLLHKTGHRALLKQLHGSEVEVKVQGHYPENFLFLVHETFETLITEAYNGVTYDYLIPCADCIKVGTYDPCMFEASKIRRATELKVPFLQCDKYFHHLSLNEIQASMPPDTSTDFDAHLERNLRDLTDLRSDMETDVFMFYCAKDIPEIGQEETKVAPRKIYEDLVENGYKVWFTPDPNSVDFKSVAITMKDAKVVVVLLSDDFVQDDQCCNVFYYAQNTLHKRLQIIVTGGTVWQKTDIGLQMAAEVYINMTNPKRYIHKKTELMDAIATKTAKKKVTHPKCFISYCWSNSNDAIKKGSRKIEGAIGWGDPREVKAHLESTGIECWMDIEQVGQGGLFEDIAEGLKHAKVVVACVSDEYTKSKNCQMELRFASSTLKLPIIVIIVGTGYTWETSEVGMLILGFPKINAQYVSPTCFERIAEAVKKVIPEEDLSDTEMADTDDSQQQAFQELLELAQRKFLRQVGSYASSLELGQYPRLFFLDFATEKDKDAEGKPLLLDSEKDDIDAEQYVIRTLCEHGQGWHVPGQALLIQGKTPAELEEFLDQIAPFAARMMAILKHTNLDYPCLNTEQGETLRQKLEMSCSLEKEYKEEYSQSLQFLMELDAARTMGGLMQCHMPNGKVLWLCKEHARTDERISSVEVEDGILAKETSTIDLSQHQGVSSKLTRLRGKLRGASGAARISGEMTVAHKNSKTCSLM